MQPRLSVTRLGGKFTDFGKRCSYVSAGDCPLTDLVTLGRYLLSLSFNFLACKIGMIIPAS